MFYYLSIFFDLMSVLGVFFMILNIDLGLVDSESMDFGIRYSYMGKMVFYLGVFGFNGYDYVWG